MADSGLLVTISGATLSQLLYENVRSPGDQMGFLLGETLTYVVKKFTDSDNQIEITKTHVNVETLLPCYLPYFVSRYSTDIDRDNLDNILKDYKKKVIGWFRFRRNVPLVPTFKDKVIHNEFISHLCKDQYSKDNFLMCLLTSTVSEMNGTHKYRHVFLRRIKSFEPVPVKINNLGSDATKLEGSDYKLTPACRSSDEPDELLQLVQSMNLDILKMPGLSSMTIIQTRVESHLRTLVSDVRESDRKVEYWKRKLKELENKIAQKKREKSNIARHLNEIDEDTDNEEDSKVHNSRYIVSLRNQNSNPSAKAQDLSFEVWNTSGIVAKTLSQEKIRATEIGRGQEHSLSSDPFADIVTELKDDMSDIVSKKNKHSSSPTSTSIARMPICKAEDPNFGVGRGRELPYNSARGKKVIGKRSFGPRSSVDRAIDQSKSEPERESLSMESNTSRNYETKRINDTSHAVIDSTVDDH
ncbi:BRISC complex subunit FAM175B-like isoform X2 [Prorops nasuta]|uniref:BRISC complex subunit FAM175B-like isoform X2 n=1 Tax=Prorops nasuta TaxID=863751 RepID=UPI0034CF4281